VIRWFGTNTDITEQIEAEKALHELNETLEQRVEAEMRERLGIWNVSQDLLVLADLEGTYLNVNPAWATTLGWSESDLLGKSSQWLLHPDDREKTRVEINNLAAGQRIAVRKPVSSQERHLSLDILEVGAGSRAHLRNGARCDRTQGCRE
jgi:PAS domain-containing protein